MGKNIKVRTRNRDIYYKLNMLNFVPEVVIDYDSEKNIKKIIGQINKKGKFIETINIGEKKLLIKKCTSDNINVSFRG